jgi:hypothetical protein
MTFFISTQRYVRGNEVTKKVAHGKKFKKSCQIALFSPKIGTESFNHTGFCFNLHCGIVISGID